MYLSDMFVDFPENDSLKQTKLAFLCKRIEGHKSFRNLGCLLLMM
jgi:hypothetical protein